MTTCRSLKPAILLIAVKKLRVGVIYGGRSGEHEVSIASAAAVVQNLDKQRYEAIPIRIEKGRSLGDRGPSAGFRICSRGDRARSHARRAAPRSGRPRGAPARPSGRRTDHDDRSRQTPRSITGLALDVVFPVLHGPYGEDGTVQGLLELAERSLRRRRRPCLGGRHGQGRRQAGVCRPRSAAGEVSRRAPASLDGGPGERGDRRPHAAGISRLRQAGESGVECRNLESQEPERAARRRSTPPPSSTGRS